MLLIHRGEVLSTDRLIDELWGERAPASAIKIVQGYVSQLRKALGDDVIVTRGHGYLLAVDDTSVDVDRFEALAAGGRVLSPTGTRRPPIGAGRGACDVAWGAAG